MLFKCLYFQIATTVLLSMCAAEIQILFPKRANLEELSPKRYYRQDAIPFKYGHVHHYSTSNPIIRMGQHLPNLYQGIQYAPLQGRLGTKNKNTAAEYTKVTPTISSTALPQGGHVEHRGQMGQGGHNVQGDRNGYAKYLEPRDATEARDPNYKCYNPGHKVEVLPSVSRSPGHNAVYRSFPDNIQRDKPIKINYNMKSYGLYNLDMLSTTMSPFDLSHQNPPPFTFTNQHYVVNPNTIAHEGNIGEKIKRQYSPYSKFHRLHLNIARVYSPGQVPQKPPVPTDTYSLNVAGIPIVALCGLVAVCQAGLLPAPVHYSSAAAVSSQNIVRHDQPAHHVAVAAPVAYHAAPAVYHAAPAVATYHAAPAPAVYHAAPTVYHAAAPAHVAYHAAPVVAHAEEFDAHPKYEYNYSVADSHTGDNKSQQESRDGDVVKGSYSFHEADGSVRTVEYSADDHSGFNAVVHNTAPTAAPVVVKAAPVILKAAPAHYYHH
ncbi:unnamed protein product [Chrysodeixis includens]|uniref:Uncharacterized protein n=1 Tax=Chrysodeixis includens TaxID=689277 RepID=A0A9N8L253_CHRIL|nr:unnamed protein product [Chrysodeixis includens]